VNIMACLTKIVATVGPASSEPATLRKLIDAGVSIFRLNFSHGDEASHAAVVRAIRAVAAEAGQATAILGDRPGPKIRVGEMAEGGVEVGVGATVVFSQGRTAGDSQDLVLTCTCAGAMGEVDPGQRVLINDGMVRMLAVERRAGSLWCSVTHGGRISTGKGINLPDTDLRVPPLTERDRRWAGWAVEHGLDFLGLSFLREAGDVSALRTLVNEESVGRGRRGLQPALIAKIERPRAVANIDSIVEVSDGVMVARGDLGVETDPAAVPVLQKRILRAAHASGKPCIVATQMLESMIQQPQPTRAEASDVAGAIFEEADAVMLSGETTIGRFPVVAVETMRRIAERAEEYIATLPARPAPPQRLMESHHPMAALAHGVWNVARDYDARFVAVWSQEGGGARYLSQESFRIPIVAFSSDERALRRAQLLRGVIPLRLEPPRDLDHFTRMVDEVTIRLGLAAPGDRCVLVAGAAVGRPRVTNGLALHQVGSAATGWRRG
jgi:pyruvate kinase